ncbi:MAG: ClpX C4-type zinc finger protein [Vicinamibacterales bacterium]
MVLDLQLLEKAREAGARLEQARRETLLSRAEYHTAIRRLHLSGAPLREIASALSLSHQRVQQIVRSAGGTWWSRAWRGRRARREAVCSWCGRPPSEVSKLVAGPNVYICDACIEAADRAAGGASTGGPFVVTVRRGGLARCAFCSKGAGRGRAVLKATAGSVCTHCLEVCKEMAASKGQPGSLRSSGLFPQPSGPGPASHRAVRRS